MEEVSSCNKDHKACEAEHIYYMALYRKFLNSCGYCHFAFFFFFFFFFLVYLFEVTIQLWQWVRFLLKDKVKYLFK